MKKEDSDVPDAPQERPVVNNHRNFSLINVILNGNHNASHNGPFLNHATQVENTDGDVFVQPPREQAQASDIHPKRRKVLVRTLQFVITIFLAAGVPGVMFEFLLPETEHEFTVITGKIKFKLPDGTTVSLARGTTLRYIPDGFDDCREVFLEGEGFFDVKPNDDIPFVIHCGNGTILKLTGGPVDINRDREAAGTMNVLVAGPGEVALYDPAGVSLGRFHEGYEVTYYPYTHGVKLRKPKKETVNDDLLSLDGVTLAEVAQRLETEFDVKITVDPAIQNCRIQATFEKKGLTIIRVLDVIGYALRGMEYYPVVGSDEKIRRVKITGRNCDGVISIPKEAVR
jgi:ferric-dicitrate binding protein FerR (iron transport regulator)